MLTGRMFLVFHNPGMRVQGPVPNKIPVGKERTYASLPLPDPASSFLAPPLPVLAPPPALGFFNVHLL